MQVHEIRTVAGTAQRLAGFQVGRRLDLDERTRVKSSTVKRLRALEARGNGISFSRTLSLSNLQNARRRDIPRYRPNCLPDA